MQGLKFLIYSMLLPIHIIEITLYVNIQFARHRKHSVLMLETINRLLLYKETVTVNFENYTDKMCV
jgi:hypothetical protein